MSVGKGLARLAQAMPDVVLEELERFRRLPAWKQAAVGFLLLQAGASLSTALSLASWPGADWDVLVDAGANASAGISPYATEGVVRLRYSPLLAYFFALIAPIGFLGWTVVGFATLLVLREWRLIAAFLLAYPFWIDMTGGMTFVIVPALALAALRGSFAASLAFIALAVLTPRPLMLPMLGWLLWHDRRLWFPGLAIAAILTGGALATGWFDEWVTELLVITESDPRDIVMPAQSLGLWWLLMVAGGVWLAIKGRLGLASLAVSPYWNPSYYLLLLLELFEPRPPMTRRAADGRPSAVQKNPI